MAVIFAHKLLRRSVVFAKELDINCLQIYLLYRILNVIGPLSGELVHEQFFLITYAKKG
jgi:hypothetical protein